MTTLCKRYALSIYADLILSSEEHHKREEKSGKPCPFFQTDVMATTIEGPKPGKKVSRRSKAAKKAVLNGESDEDAEAAAVKQNRKASDARE